MKKNFKLSKRDRDEKRRLLLGKESETETTQTNEAGFARANGSARFLKVERDGAATATPLSRRMLAIILAIVFVLTVVPTAVFVGLKGRADEGASFGPVTMKVRANGANNYTTAVVPAGDIRNHLNDIEFHNDLPNGVEFEKALMVDTTANTETEIASVSAVVIGDNENTYYSVSANSDTGTLLKANQELVLVYAAKYQVTKNTSENGTITTSALHDEDDNYDFVWGGNALRVQAKPNTDYTVSAITYSIDGGASKTAAVSNNAATIAANDITGDIDINVTFSRISEYTVTEENGYHGGMTNSREANIGHEGADGVAPGGTARFYVYSESNTGGSDFVFNMLSINEVDIDYPTNEGDHTDPQPFKNGTVTVTLVDTDTYLAWKSGDTNIIGGQAKYRSLYYIEVTDVHEDLKVSFNFKQKDSQEIIIKGLRGIQETGSMGERRGLNRYIHLNGNIDDNASIINWGFAIGTRNYTFNKNDNNIYPAYYNDYGTNLYSEGLTNFGRFMPSANIYLYRVKPGYNPYSVKDANVRAVYYADDGTKTSEVQGDALLAGDSSADRPEQVIMKASANIDDQIDAYIEENAGSLTDEQKGVIRNALRTLGSYDSKLRYWGESSLLTNTGDVASRRNYGESSRTAQTELALTTLKVLEESDSTQRWYAVALEQNESKNQQLYLNAAPYNYSLQLETGTASFSASGYTTATIDGIDGNVYIETEKHTVEDAQKYIVLPSNIPSKGNDYIFQGWQLVDATGQALDGYVYQSNEQVPLTDTILASAYGDPESDDLTIRLQAVFEEISHASTAKVSATTYYQDPNGSVTLDESEGKTYTQRPTSESVQPVGEETAILNTYEPTPAKYYALSSASHLNGTVVPQETYSEIPKENQFKAIYDLKLYDFTLKKELFGRTKYTSFDISLKLTRPNDYPYSLSDMKNHIITMADSTGVTVEEDADNDALIYTKTFGNQDTLSFSGIPYGWNYEVVEAEREKDDSSTSITATSVSTGKRTSQEGKTFSGTVEEATNIVVTNQKENDDPNIVSDKWLEKEAGGDTYKLTMESYSIGATITETQTDPVPMDIALVIDQSGSMGTKDVNPVYKLDRIGDADDESNPIKTTWTVSEATAGETHYYLADNGKYYPVQAEEGVLYEKVANDPYIYQMIGRGHDGLVSASGSPVHFNVPTKYYALDSNNKIHKVYAITVGEFAQYAANTYYYTDEDEAKEIVTDYTRDHIWQNRWFVSSDVIVNENHPYNNGEEWSESILWFDLAVISNLSQLDGLWNSTNLYKTQYSEVRSHYNNDTNFVSNDLVFGGSYIWRSLAYNGQVCFVGQPDATISSANNNMMHYSWISNGDPATDLYLPKDGTNYNRLYYVDDNNQKVYLDDAVDVAEATAYNGELYVVRGEKTRTQALEEAVTEFTQKIAQNAQETGAEHRMSIIGFAGNKFPALSVGETAYAGTTTYYDYTDSGLFLNTTFKNYQTITGSTSTTNPFINLHYYTSVDGDGKPTGTPVEYRSGTWYYIGTDDDYDGSTFYEPIYSGLSAADYDASLVEVSNGGAVNSKLTNAIENFGYYGGTYTSYGMAMANNVFTNSSYDGTYEDSQGNTKQRQKVIIVFTDGEPGANGYDTSIAGEALAEGYKAKDALGTIVYTIGLYPGNVTQQVTDFMEQLSSEYSIEKTDVYGGTNNGVSETGSGTLDGDNIYYFENPEDNKTYAVTTKKDGLSTLGWWRKTDTGYIRCYPKTSSNDSRTIDGQSVITFYNAGGSAVYEENLSPGTVYFTSNSTRNATTAIKYEYRWYDSNGKVRDPIKQNYGTYDTDRNTYQFFKLDRESPVENEDGKQYYYQVKETKDLLDAFSETFENITTLSSQLDFGHSLIRDVISDDFTFDAVDHPAYKIELIKGTQNSENGDIVFDSDESNWEDVTTSYSRYVDFEDNTFTLKGFDFSENYIAYGKEAKGDMAANQGKKVRITITGLKPTDEATGGIFESNTGESGVCKLLEDDNGQVTDDFKLIDAFPKPSISRYKYTIDVDGDDTTATYDTAFVLKDKDGNQLADGATLLEEMKHAKTSNNDTWTDNGQIQNVENKRQKSIIFEEIRDVEQFEVLLEGDQYKHGDSIPDDYQIAATVTGTNMNTTNYTFTDKFNDDAAETFTPTTFTKTLLKQDNTIHISSREERRTVTIQEITKAKDGDPDYSDKEHVFNVLLVLKDASGNPTEYTYDTFEFDSRGELTIPMNHNDAVTFEVPVGYQVEIFVDDQTQGGYERSYKENGIDKEGPNYASGNILDYTSIQVINSLAAPDIASGVLDENNPFGIILAVLAGICAIAGGGTAFYTRKRKKEEN